MESCTIKLDIQASIIQYYSVLSGFQYFKVVQEENTAKKLKYEADYYCTNWFFLCFW